MAKRCRNCGAENDGGLFCSFCGGPLDDELKFMMDLEKESMSDRKGPRRPVGRYGGDEDYVYKPAKKTVQKESSIAPLVIILLIVLAGLAFLLLRG